MHPRVAFTVVPIIGFANASVSLAGITPDNLIDPIPLGVALGLLFGKQLGILGGHSLRRGKAPKRLQLAPALWSSTALRNGVHYKSFHRGVGISK